MERASCVPLCVLCGKRMRVCAHLSCRDLKDNAKTRLCQEFRGYARKWEKKRVVDKQMRMWYILVCSSSSSDVLLEALEACGRLEFPVSR